MTTPDADPIHTAVVGVFPGREEARLYESDPRDGRALVTVRRAPARADDARALRRHGGSVRRPADVGTDGTGRSATPY